MTSLISYEFMVYFIFCMVISFISTVGLTSSMIWTFEELPDLLNAVYV